MADLGLLVLDVQSRIQLDESVFKLYEIQRFVELASQHQFPGRSIASLTNTEAVAVMLKAQISIYHAMASRYARHFPIRTINAETSENVVVKNYLDIAKSLQLELDELVNDNFNDDFVVKQGKLIRRDTYRGYGTEAHIRGNLPDYTTLIVYDLTGSWVSGNLMLSWVPTTNKYFHHYEIWSATSAGIYDASKSHLVGTAPVASGATKLREIHVANIGNHSVEGLANQATYVVIFSVAQNGQYFVSEEILVQPVGD